MTGKRISFKCTDDINSKIETLKVLTCQSRDVLLSKLINEHFKEIITNIAIKEGVVEKSHVLKNKSIRLNEVDFVEKEVFEKLCDELGVSDDALKVSSILLEINKTSVVE